MIQVRMRFQAKTGCAQELVAGLKQGIEVVRAINPAVAKVRILTDLSGPFDTVVQEIEFDSLEDFMQGMAKLWSDPRWQELEKKRLDRDILVSGSKEY